MFDNILEQFTDFPTVDILFYAPVSTYNPVTGEMTEGYEYDYTVSAHGFQKSSIKNVVSDKVWDQVDFVFIFSKDYQPPKDDIVYFDEQWYKVIYPDDVGFAASVCTMGAQRIEEQIVTSDPPEDHIVLGDSGGII